MKNHVPFNGSAKFFQNDSESFSTSFGTNSYKNNSSQPLVKFSSVSSSSNSGLVDQVIHEPSTKLRGLEFIVPLKSTIKRQGSPAYGTKKKITQQLLPRVKDEANIRYNNMLKKTNSTRGPNKKKNSIFVQMEGVKGQVVGHYATAAEESHRKVQ
jgi:hypothetical protein